MQLMEYVTRLFVGGNKQKLARIFVRRISKENFFMYTCNYLLLFLFFFYEE
ncbi:hypothetical protein RhiirC2_14895 [Rhizophagus irregularis]|uniref:Uncharacterized protein n=1 Tax=Rhizophagus irregularis TaxID=588596 RepID=A0A2N1MZ45_9GLOM|nr:hypothetical protein RhiirC2_14895 [Rhizophagus irregularis]